MAQLFSRNMVNGTTTAICEGSRTYCRSVMSTSPATTDKGEVLRYMIYDGATLVSSTANGGAMPTQKYRRSFRDLYSNHGYNRQAVAAAVRGAA